MLHLLPGPRDRRDLRNIVIGVLVPLALAFAAAILLVHQQHKSVYKLVSDPAAAMRVNPLLGFFSNVGVLGWAAGAVVSAFSAWILARTRAAHAIVRFYLAASAFTTLLLLDDFFLIHDALAPRYLHLPQNAVYAAYALCFVAFVIGCRREILARNPALFVVAVGLLGFMAGLDAIRTGRTAWAALAMSGSKFLGIFAWSAWLIRSAQRDIQAVLRPGP